MGAPNLILQRKYKGEYHTLEVWNSGRIICDCIAGMYNTKRDICTDCSHTLDLISCIHKGDITDYFEVQE